MNILVVHGPNLNQLGKRDPHFYGIKTLEEINSLMDIEAESLGIDIVIFQSNNEGEIITFIQEETPNARGIIINPAALTHYGLSLREALADTKLPVIEVHLSNIYARPEPWRHTSVIAPVATGQVSGLGWRGYIIALNYLVQQEQERRG